MDVILQDYYIKIIDNILSIVGPRVSRFSSCPEGVYALTQIVNNKDITFNHNEIGRLHSKYLGDRYEPAIILQHLNTLYYYYLFDGEIKDCIHPFMVRKDSYPTSCYSVLYYSSERIEQGLPIKIYEYTSVVQKYYFQPSHNITKNSYAEYLEEIVSIDYYLEQDYTLHKCMESRLKFAD